ncbi:MAG: hypothetical protein FWE27_03460 [Defluviitaleaceae bacterium]|nr:hypothetical protein [Defluviitaleaceae bacterium]
MAYTRFFLSLESEASGFDFKGRAPAGRCIVESRGGMGKLSVWAQDIKTQTRYGVYLIFADSGRYVGISMGSLNADEKGKAEMRKDFAPAALGRYLLDELVGVAVITAESLEKSSVVSPLCGYRDRAVSWRGSFYEVKRGEKKEERIAEEKTIPVPPSEPEIISEAVTEVKSEIASECEPEVAPEIICESEAESEPESEPEVAPEIFSESEPEVASEIDSEYEPDVAPEIVLECEPEVAPKIDSESEPEVASEIDSECEPEVASEIDCECEPEVALEIDSECEPEVASEIDSEYKPYVAPEIVSESEPEDVPEIASEYKLYVAPEIASEVATEIEPEIISEAVPKTSPGPENISEPEIPPEPTPPVRARQTAPRARKPKGAKPISRNEMAQELNNETKTTPARTENILAMETIFSRKKHIKPFENFSRETTWVKLTIADAVPLPYNRPLLLEEPFVRAAYANHDHLLLGLAADGIEYIIGVPCEYNPEERHHAKRLGFSQFKTNANGPPKRGDKGYWLMFLDM